MDYKILVKLALIIYIISMPIVGSVPIYYYVSQVKCYMGRDIYTNSARNLCCYIYCV